MGFWQSFRAALRNPDIVDELEAERTTRKQLSAALVSAEQDLEGAETDIFLLERKLERVTTKVDACRAAVMAFCSQPPSIVELKRIYGAIAPVQDKGGFTLYFSARKLTGIDVSSQFPYEENRGLFEGMDGHQLLRWLTAARFHAVDWTAVPGTCHEAATLWEVDTSTPEYQEFERQVYGKALERLGFKDILAPSREAVREAAKNHEHEQKGGER